MQDGLAEISAGFGGRAMAERMGVLSRRPRWAPCGRSSTTTATSQPPVVVMSRPPAWCVVSARAAPWGHRDDTSKKTAILGAVGVRAVPAVRFHSPRARDVGLVVVALCRVLGARPSRLCRGAYK